MFIETDRVVLRDITRDDNDELYLLESDPEIMQFVSNGVPVPREEVEAGTERILNLRNKHNGKFGCWAALDKSTGKFIGWFLFRPDYNAPENTKRIELGYRLKKEYWGLGIATEVSKAIIDKGFSEYPLEEIFAVAVKGQW
jgi:RimJ/RimL family protein N-acetyltransferase